MTAANLNIIAIDRRMLTKTEAAHFCGLPVRKFPAVCPVVPVELAKGIERYDRRDLDKWLDSLSLGENEDEDAIVGKLA